MKNYNSRCYRMDNITYNTGLLDNIIDAVYVLLMENSDRTENVYNQLNDYKLSKNTYIQINKGYKKCDKKLMKNQSNYDLVDSNYNIWLHANENNYNNILILEDDFIFDNRIEDANVLKDLDDFINNNDFDIYSIGSHPFLFYPSLFTKHPRIIRSGCAHSIILTKNIRSILIDRYNNDNTFLEKSNGHMDSIYHHGNYKYHIYYKPLCYQIFPETDNQNTWDEGLDIFSRLCLSLHLNFMKAIQLDKYPQPGFDIYYLCSYIWNTILYLTIIYIIYIIYKNTICLKIYN